MSDTPKFTVVDRRKFRAEEDSPSRIESMAQASTAASDRAEAGQEKLGVQEKQGGARLTLVEPSGGSQKGETAPIAVAEHPAFGHEAEAVEAEADEPELEAGPGEGVEEAEMAPAPSTEEIRFQKLAYDKAAERLEDLVRAQNPAAPPSEKIGFEHLVQQLYLSAMMQMGAGTPEGQRPRIDILGARQTIDLLSVVLEKSKGNLSNEEERTLQTVLYELRLTFLELTRMISAPQPPMPPPPGAKR